MAFRNLPVLWDCFWIPRGKHMQTTDPMVNHEAFLVAAKWLNLPEIDVVEDWGCGHAQFRRCLAPHQEYRGVDASDYAYADVVADLASYHSEVAGIHMRGVLEHNTEWKRLLSNLLDSAQVRAVVTLFVPMVKTHVDNWNKFSAGGEMLVQHFTHAEIKEVIGSRPFFSKEVPGKNNNETVFLIGKPVGPVE